MSTALVLFAHGSRNPDWRAPFERIATQVRQNGYINIVITPLFFGLGNHVTRDLQDLTQAFSHQHPNILLKIAPPLGESELVLSAMADYACATLSGA
jgi:sirohydrochlorin cobaltochelatase